MLTSNGEILTNNHVVDGATKITVTVVSTGQSYTATVVGTDATDDVAVLQLSDASGLSTAKLSSDAASVGDAVTAVGNAGGTGGTPSAATGTVTALDQSITASDEAGSDPEQLTGMIQVDADIQAGDSGGPLYDSDGEVVGIDTAASSGQSASTVGFAIPIAKATSIADRIESGEDSATIQQGTPAFLGVQLAQDATGGATISGVVDGSPAAEAGLQAGDTITAVGGTTVDSADALSAALAKQRPGRPGAGHLGRQHRQHPHRDHHPGRRPGSLTPGGDTGAAADSARVRRGAGACDLVVLVDGAGAQAGAAPQRRSLRPGRACSERPYCLLAYPNAWIADDAGEAFVYACYGGDRFWPLTADVAVFPRRWTVPSVRWGRRRGGAGGPGARPPAAGLPRRRAGRPCRSRTPARGHERPPHRGAVHGRARPRLAAGQGPARPAL